MILRSSVAFLILVLGSSKAEWRPLDSPSSGYSEAGSRSLVGGEAASRIFDSDRCNLYKVVMHQEGYYQYIQYKSHVPDMKEFTLCSWHKLYNHTTDHPIFSYAVKEQPREIVSWVSNDLRSSYYMLAIGGHTIYRLNYPLKKYKWYHSCQSWNGRTGEWQLWIDSERVGRGFYNLLVGKKIKGNGIAITGQEQRKYGGGFELNPKPGGLMGEVTLVHLYKAALTAGKAYNNHKHHHAHKFLHEGEEEQQMQLTPVAPPQPELPEGVTEYPFLRNMQIIPRLPINELSVLRQQQELQRMQAQMQQEQLQQQFQQQLQGSTDFLSPFSSQTLRLFKRENQNDSSVMGSESKTVKVMVPAPSRSNLPKQKRGVDFGVFPGVDLSSIYTSDGFQLGGGIIPFQDQRLQDPQQDSPVEEEPVPKKWNEPAEWEVRSIMSLCSGCGEDPFRKANVLSWREASKKLYAGALYVPAAQECHHF